MPIFVLLLRYKPKVVDGMPVLAFKQKLHVVFDRKPLCAAAAAVDSI